MMVPSVVYFPSGVLVYFPSGVPTPYATKAAAWWPSERSRRSRRRTLPLHLSCAT
jgi:hypothetical protein